jgi:hypothetical protein
MPDNFFILILVKKACKARVSKQVIMRKYSMAKYFNTIEKGIGKIPWLNTTVPYM